MIPSPCLLASTATVATLADDLAPAFNQACVSRAYVGIILTDADRSVLAAVMDAVDAARLSGYGRGSYTADAVTDAPEQDALRDGLLVAAKRGSWRVRQAFLQAHGRFMFGRAPLLTCEKAIESVEKGVGCVSLRIPGEDGLVEARFLRIDIAQALADLRLTMHGLDVEGFARRWCSHMDDHERPATRQADIDEEARLFAETYPDFHGLLNGLVEKLGALEVLIDEIDEAVFVY